MKKKKKEVFLLLSALIALAIIVNPSHLNAQTGDGLPNMSFLNDRKTSAMQQTMSEIFPPGTSKDFVEKSLIEKGGATYKGKIDIMHTFPGESNVHSYEYRKPFYLRFLHNGRYVITIFYDENNRMKNKVKMSDGRVVAGILISGPGAL